MEIVIVFFDDSEIVKNVIIAFVDKKPGSGSLKKNKCRIKNTEGCTRLGPPIKAPTQNA